MQNNQPERNINLKLRYIAKAFVVLILIIASAVIVYCMGGTGSAFAHIMYLPIILSAYYFGIVGSVVTAILGGLALGPHMYENVSSELMQQSSIWIVRLIVFITFGIIISLLFMRIKGYEKEEAERSHVNLLTGLPNANKLKVDLDELIESKTEFSLIGFRIENINNIKQNISYETGVKSIKKALEILSELTDSTAYSIDDNTFAIVLPSGRIENAQTLGERFLYKTFEPVLIDQIKIGLLIKCGIVNFPLHAEDSYEMITKINMVLEQAKGEIGLYIYNGVLEKKSKSRSELVPHLLNAINNNEFYLVYQPKESIIDDGTISVEALLRWNNPTIGQISPSEFIVTAEEIGLIGEITKWVIKNVIEQKEKWKKTGLDVKIAFNISPKDLNNNSVMNYFIEVINNKELDLSLLEVELTERAVLENREIVIMLFNALRKIGIKIALDDFGTGYNSLINLVQFPADHIKIDKKFIDNITENTYKLVIKYTIGSAHRLGRKVVAEGVETKEQFDILKNIGCDYIQGYYISKPILPDELEDYLASKSPCQPV
ncbi:MAG: EAL domain-containing protein [Oscillospiraceae bacterium]|nr:EAL domain-containing protein [Oscillospiraceae bacterium]MDD4413954.1 EAL domain-containing protein [Oscillospiraceae bacterium]